MSIETGARRVFASALDWPGWARSAKTEDLAIETLLAYEPRFAVVAADAGWPLPASGSWCVVVVERLPGGATTDFGAPGAIGDFDRKALTRREAARAADLVAGAWRVFDRVVARAPSTLRKGPRGGGRDLDAIVAHVKDAQDAYARKLGMGKPRGQEEILAVLRGARSADPIKPNGWPPRYAARRIAWHVVDHAWEIEDRSR